MTNNPIIPAHTAVIPAHTAVIPAPAIVIPASSPVIPAQAGIQNVLKNLYSRSLSSNIFIAGRNNSFGTDVHEKSKAQR